MPCPLLVQLCNRVFNQVYLANTTGFRIYRETLSRFIFFLCLY